MQYANEAGVGASEAEVVVRFYRNSLALPNKEAVATIAIPWILARWLRDTLENTLAEGTERGYVPVHSLGVDSAPPVAQQSDMPPAPEETP